MKADEGRGMQMMADVGRWTIVAFGLFYVPKNVLEPCMWIFG